MNRLSPDLLLEALETIDEALGIYDAEDHLVAYNSKYAEVRSAIGGEVTLGANWDDLVTASLKAGTIPEAAGREEEWLEQRRHARGSYSVVRTIPDGRTYQVNERRMASGGVAVIWADITKLLQERNTARQWREIAERAEAVRREIIQRRAELLGNNNA
jgi:hypothetical protein